MSMKRMLAAILMMAGILCLCMAAKEEWPYVVEKLKELEVRNAYVQEDEGEGGYPAELERQIDFTGLKRVNPDIVAWIYVPGTPIDYPVLKNPYDNYYLTHDFEGAYSKLGAIFMQAAASEDFVQRHTILYGHNMASGQMFGRLKWYAQKEFRDAHPYIYIYQPKQTLRCRVYSVYECLDGSDTYQTVFSDDKEYHLWQQMTAASDDAQTTVPSRKEQVLTLSTCTDSGYMKRLVVHSVIERYVRP